MSGPAAEPTRAGTSSRVLRLGLLALAALGALACGPSGVADEASEPDAWVEIRGQRVAVEIPSSPAEHRLGLGRRDELAWDRGMLFQYERPGFYRFWMNEMRFDIDIVFIRDGRIVDIAHRVQHVPGEPGPTVTPDQLADSVLEVPAGYARSRRWRIGHRVRIEHSGQSDESG